MSELFPVVYLARHGETAWSLSGQHTGRTDLPLTPNGERNAKRLGGRLSGLTFAKVFASPLQRASRTCELAGFGARAEIDRDLIEWDYGEYEGRTSAQIHTERPNWDLFRDGCPGGESPAHVGERADRVVQRIRGRGKRVAFFKWPFPSSPGRAMAGTGSGTSRQIFSSLGYEHNLCHPVISALEGSSVTSLTEIFWYHDQFR